jgi:predicted dehydrogenase
MIKLCSRDPSPPPYAYVRGGGGIFADMAVHDLDMTRFFWLARIPLTFWLWFLPY